MLRICLAAMLSFATSSSLALAEDANDVCQKLCMKACATKEPYLMKTQMNCRDHCVPNCIHRRGRRK